jgi:DNA (cytosine-5)-methyltransferase 1
VSAAGRRAGIAPHTRSGLWAHFATAIGRLRPRLVVIENVRGLLSARATHPGHDAVEPCPGCLGEGHGEPALRALGAVLGDLADLGFDAEWASVRASDVGAPHQRLRIIVLAWPAADTGRHPRAENDPDQCTAAGHHRTAAHAEREARGRHEQRRVTPRPAEGTLPETRGRTGRDRSTPAVTDWGPYDPAIARWEQLTRPAPPPTETGTKGQPRLSPAFVEWMMGLPDGWVTAIPGLTRNQQLKTLGNGVVPQQAAHALTTLLARITPPVTEDGEAA